MPTYNTGNINQTMRVTGFGLYALSGLEVPRQGFIDFSYYDASPEYIEFSVPENISYGDVNFYFITGQSVSDPLFKSGISFFPIPKIDSVTPPSQEVGEFVAISGKSLTGVSYVSFNNITGTNIFYDEASGGLMVKVPSGYTTGPIRISGYNNSGIVNTISNFDFLGRIFISGFSDNLPYEGDLLTISGKNFSTSFVNESYFPVYFTSSTDGITTGFVEAKFTGVGNNGDKISGIVPEGAHSGYVVINSKDNTSFTSRTAISVLRAPSVFSALKYYCNSGESNIVIGKNLENVSSITLSGLNFRKPKNILNSGVKNFETGVYNKSLLFSGGAYLVADSPANGDFKIGAGDFTIEFFINPISIPSSRVDLINDAAGFFLYKPASSSNWTFYADGSSMGTFATSNTPINTWTKVSISRIGTNTHVFTKNASSQSSATNSATSNSLQAGLGLYIGRLYTGLEDSLGVNKFEGYLDELRISNIGRYSSSSFPNTGLQLFDDQNTLLFLQGNSSDYSIRGDRNKLSNIPYITGYVEDYNFGARNQSFTLNSLTKNSAGSSISYTNNVAPGIYDLTLTNVGNRTFTFENFQIVKSDPVIKNISTLENYIGGDIEFFGHNFYPDTQVVFQDTGNANSLVNATEDSESYSYQSIYRPRKNIFKNFVSLSDANSKYDGKTFSFSSASSTYLKFNITGQYPNQPLGYGKSFCFELDFKPSSTLSSSDNKYIIASKSGINIFATTDQVVISGIDWEGFTPVFSGKIIEKNWNHLSISKSYINSSSISGKILLNGSGLNLSGDGFDYGNSNLDFSLNSDKVTPFSNFEIFVGVDSANNVSSLWDGYIDEINIQRKNPYQYQDFQPDRRARNNIDTELLLHASVGFIDDNIRDFGYLRINTPNLSSIRKSKILLDNGYSQLTGGFDKTFTFLKTPVITGFCSGYSGQFIQGEYLTGFGTDLYYIKTLSVGGYATTGFDIINSGSEFEQAIVFKMPDLAQSGDFLNLSSDYFNYTYPSGFNIRSGNLSIDGFFPTTGMAGSLINVSGKFLNTVTSILLGSQDGMSKTINSFASQDISNISFYIPNVYDITDGPIRLINPYASVLSEESLIFLNPSINKIIPSSAYYEDTILLSGSNLSGLEFYGLGVNNDLVKFENVSSISGTGVTVTVPRDIKSAAFKFFYSGTSGTTGELAGYSRIFYPSTTISGVNTTGYVLKDPIVITGINANVLQSRDLYISGYNHLTKKTGQYIIAQNLSIIDVSTLTGTGFYQPYTGYSILSGQLNVSVASYSSFPDFDLIYSGTDPLGVGTNLNFADYGSLNLDGFIGSGEVFFQRNSFDPDRLFNTITISAPKILNSGINISTGSVNSLITLSGSNLNYITGIRFVGAGTLLVGKSGSPLSNPEDLRPEFKTGILIDIDASSVNPNLIYKDFNKIQFYPPSVAGKNVHRKDVEDIRPVSGMFYLTTYLNEIYPVSGRFNYIPTIRINDAYLNNRLTYRLDGTSQVSGFDGSIISFVGEGARYLTGVDFFSESNDRILENFPTVFQTEKQKASITLLNAANQNITGYIIHSGGKGYTSNPSVTLAAGAGGTPSITALVSFLPPYVGTVTGIIINTNAYDPLENYWSGSKITISNPANGFIQRTPANLLFSGTNYSLEGNDGSKYYAYYTTSTTFPLNNDFVVGEKLNFKLSNYGSIYETTDFPFLVIQNPNNYSRITDIILTGSFMEEKKFRINYSQFYSSSDADFNLLDAQVKTSILYPTGYVGKQIILTSFKPSKNGKFIDIEFSSKVPYSGEYVVFDDPEDSKYIKLRIEAINTEASLFKGLGSSSSKSVEIQGLASAGSNSPGMGI